VAFEPRIELAPLEPDSEPVALAAAAALAQEVAAERIATGWRDIARAAGIGAVGGFVVVLAIRIRQARRLLPQAVATGEQTNRPARRQSVASVAARLAADVSTTIRPPAPPRVVPFIVLKRINSRLGDTYGHWWLEVNGTESFGWWPRRCPMTVRDFLFGTEGRLNGVEGSCRGGTPTRDPHHGDPADHEFHPTLLVRKSDRKLRADIRDFARRYSGEWRGKAKPVTQQCPTLQLSLVHSFGLTDCKAYRYTKGPG